MQHRPGTVIEAHTFESDCRSSLYRVIETPPRMGDSVFDNLSNPENAAGRLLKSFCLDNCSTGFWSMPAYRKTTWIPPS